MSNYQCFCYGIIAIHNILEEKLPITSDLFLDELYYLWDIYSEESIEKIYLTMEEKRDYKKLKTCNLEIGNYYQSFPLGKIIRKSCRKYFEHWIIN